MTQLKEGMRVKHKLINEELIVVADEKGPAYTGNDFKDNEISMSFAKQELRNGVLEILQDESQEVKEGGELFTKGEWAIIGELQKDKHMCPVPYYEIGSKDGHFWTAHVNASPMSNNESEAEANAALIAQSKNMYYCLLDFMDIVKGITSVPNGTQLTVTIPASLFENTSIVLQKAAPKK